MFGGGIEMMNGGRAGIDLGVKDAGGEVARDTARLDVGRIVRLRELGSRAQHPIGYGAASPAPSLARYAGCGGGAARFTRAIAVDDAALREIVRRDLELDAVAQQQFDVMAAQAARDVREDFVAVLQFDAERRARVDLLDRAEHLDHRLLRRFVDPFDPLRGGFAALGRPSRRARYDCTML